MVLAQTQQNGAISNPVLKDTTQTSSWLRPRTTIQSYWEDVNIDFTEGVGVEPQTLASHLDLNQVPSTPRVAPSDLRTVSPFKDTVLPSAYSIDEAVAYVDVQRLEASNRLRGNQRDTTDAPNLTQPFSFVNGGKISEPAKLEYRGIQGTAIPKGQGPPQIQQTQTPSSIQAPKQITPPTSLPMSSPIMPMPTIIAPTPMMAPIMPLGAKAVDKTNQMASALSSSGAINDAAKRVPTSASRNIIELRDPQTGITTITNNTGIPQTHRALGVTIPPGVTRYNEILNIPSGGDVHPVMVYNGKVALSSPRANGINPGDHVVRMEHKNKRTQVAIIDKENDQTIKAAFEFDPQMAMPAIKKTSFTQPQTYGDMTVLEESFDPRGQDMVRFSLSNNLAKEVKAIEAVKLNDLGNNEYELPRDEFRQVFSGVNELKDFQRELIQKSEVYQQDLSVIEKDLQYLEKRYNDLGSAAESRNVLLQRVRSKGDSSAEMKVYSTPVEVIKNFKAEKLSSPQLSSLQRTRLAYEFNDQIPGAYAERKEGKETVHIFLEVANSDPMRQESPVAEYADHEFWALAGITDRVNLANQRKENPSMGEVHTPNQFFRNMSQEVHAQKGGYKEIDIGDNNFREQILQKAETVKRVEPQLTRLEHLRKNKQLGQTAQ